MKITIIGASGFLGTKLFNEMSKEHEIVGAYDEKESEGISHLDALNLEEVRNFLTKHKPEVVIDTVALTSSFLCEKDPELCEKLNYTTAKNIAEVCKEIKATMIFISSSYLFNGKEGNYSEKDELTPVNQYAIQKIKAEKEISKLDKFLILRVDMLYGYNAKDKLNGILGKILSGKEFEVGNPNQIRQPLLIDDFPKIISKLIQKNEKGIINVAGADRIKTIDFLKKLESLVREDSKIKILNEEDLMVKPMKDSSLNISKLNSLGIKTSSLDEGLKKLQELLNH